ncbi:hypothetical protein BDN70DRAFT_878247 [Pholiota conissans]|uniref:GST N-terminal domain-containing protein n=1 Tax=Pholiota conissans TaxID=109636 RepID=A0A9P6D1S1_9AGAR|nr:hypothetical protein BDN70DRAFT_878247 [Pholiota conissans]
MTIIFYDIPSSVKENAWSPNTWKVRYALNFKGIPYKTEWIEYPDIEAFCKKLGIAHTSLKADGRPHYTLPAIHDPRTGVYLSDSLLIAEYLEKTYPDAPSLFPHNTLGLQWPFNDLYGNNLAALWSFSLPASCFKLNPPSAAYFRETREATFGKTMEDLIPKGEEGVKEWAKYKEGLGKVDAWYAKTSGPFLMGDTVSWADFVVAAYIVWLRIIWGEDSKEWKDITSWHDGRWKGLIENLKKYETVV